MVEKEGKQGPHAFLIAASISESSGIPKGKNCAEVAVFELRPAVHRVTFYSRRGVAWARLTWLYGKSGQACPLLDGQAAG
jgi:hypothetical protein